MRDEHAKSPPRQQQEQQQPTAISPNGEKCDFEKSNEITGDIQNRNDDENIGWKKTELKHCFCFNSVLINEFIELIWKRIKAAYFVCPKNNPNKMVSDGISFLSFFFCSCGFTMTNLFLKSYTGQVDGGRWQWEESIDAIHARIVRWRKWHRSTFSKADFVEERSANGRGGMMVVSHCLRAAGDKTYFRATCCLFTRRFFFFMEFSLPVSWIVFAKGKMTNDFLMFFPSFFCWISLFSLSIWVWCVGGFVSFCTFLQSN